MYYQSVAYTTKGFIDSSLDIARRCLDILSGPVHDVPLLASVHNQMGRCYMRKSQYKEAIEMGFKTMSGAEQANDVLLQVKGKTLVGWAYLEMGQLNNALSWHLKALHTTADTILLEKYGILFANIALNYIGLGKKDSAFYYIDKAILFSRKHENLFALSNSLAIRSQIYIRSGFAAAAEESLKEAITIRKLIGDPFYIVSDMSQLGLYYANYGDPKKGIAICNEGIAIAKQYKLDTKLVFLYSSLGDNYKAMRDSSGYASVLENIIQLKDAVFRQNSARALAELQTKYELEKKENFIIIQNQEIERQRYFLYGLLILAIFLLIAGWILFRFHKKRQQVELERMRKEEKERSDLEVMKASENERKRIAADLHDNLGAYAASIASNIDNIKTNEDAEANAGLQELRNNSRSIVSQLTDTIWVLKKETLSLTAVSDRIKVFIQRIRPDHPQKNMDVFENISTDILMPASKAFHLFQIMQEAIINAAKHSSGQYIRIYIESQSQWKVVVSDDGKGMSSSNINLVKGIGITGMLSRANEAGLIIEWEKNEPAGTNVIIQPTTN